MKNHIFSAKVKFSLIVICVLRTFAATWRLDHYTSSGGLGTNPLQDDSYNIGSAQLMTLVTIA
jgi:hypothetical protein